MKVTAVDADIGENADITYAITGRIQTSLELN